MTSHHADSPIDLRARAERAARDAGFETRFSPQAQAQAARILAGQTHDGASGDDSGHDVDGAVRDMRGTLWSSIDNEESRDLDQVEWCERGPNNSIRVLIGIADVASQVAKGTPIDEHATHNTTSLYTGVETFSMLPDELSQGLTSLLPGQDRNVVVIEMSIGADGQVQSSDVFRARVGNRAKLVYESIGGWLEGEISTPLEVSDVPGLEAQIRLQSEAASRLKARRQSEGALDVDLPEARPVVVDGRVTGVQVPRKNPARAIIESFMVAANMVLAQFLQSRGLAAIQRVVREPERWPRIMQLARDLGADLPARPDAIALAAFLRAQKEAAPHDFGELSLSILKLLGRGEYAVVRAGAGGAGHFGLGMHAYAHSTAPNRRLPDLITQRIVLAELAGEPAPYSGEELEEIAARCSEREGAAQKVERLMRKVAMASLLQDRVGQVFEATVTGASSKGVYVRASSPAIEGRLTGGGGGLDVGDRLRVRLVRADAERGFIDFERA